ncbi:PTS sugar transporter subunit IIA [Oceanobacillus jeddahense]|uniref:PTS sugar transporter subunit IIA n=1 Tax=Oceanobacillus jeddahense TaxID=1462527 RepID=A0ABY5JT76_9BACI|nr:PTS sugar transporter subunit IIA [Oceanobacillus jeddahense]UUI03316.1 PTS sugar transporter subunit IIA [Oceanobacillus jeddahense]
MSVIKTDSLFKENLVKINQNSDSKSDFFKEVSVWLNKQGYVTESFGEAIYNREIEFPTGLHTASFDVAIPHTDPQYIIDPFIAVVRPDKPIAFKEMGNLNNEIAARLIFVIGFKKGEDQLEILKRLMAMFNDQEVMNRYMSLNKEEEIFSELVNYFKK